MICRRIWRNLRNQGGCAATSTCPWTLPPRDGGRSRSGGRGGSGPGGLRRSRLSASGLGRAAPARRFPGAQTPPAARFRGPLAGPQPHSPFTGECGFLRRAGIGKNLSGGPRAGPLSGRRASPGLCSRPSPEFRAAGNSGPGSLERARQEGSTPPADGIHNAATPHGGSSHGPSAAYGCSSGGNFSLAGCGGIAARAGGAGPRSSAGKNGPERTTIRKHAFMKVFVLYQGQKDHSQCCYAY